MSAETIPRTWFASPERAERAQIERQLVDLLAHPATDLVLEAFSGLVAILNEHRQIVASNVALMRELGVADPEALLGRRPGEALGCRNARAAPSGCGTGEPCRDCGAVLAILAALDGLPDERECLLTTRRDGVERSWELVVRASPLRAEGRDYVVLTLRDVSAEKRRDALVQTFLHDAANTAGALAGLCDVLSWSSPDEHPALHAQLQLVCGQLVEEFEAQRALHLAEAGRWVLRRRPTRVPDVLARLRSAFAGHRAALGRGLDVPVTTAVVLHTDPVLLGRVLQNMVVNALEATPVGGTVGVAVRVEPAAASFEVHNPGAMPSWVQARVFTRSFSTKGGPGRGLGTWGMRLLGERCLGGTVSFTSTEAEGTTFRLILPRVGG